MYLTTHNLIWLFLTGSVAGVLGAILGIGGGVFLVPALTLAFNIPAHHAIATSIVSVIATSNAVVAANVKKGLTNMRLGMTLAISTVLGGMLGALTAAWLSGPTLMRIFSVVMLITAAAMGWRSKTGGTVPSGTRNDDRPDESQANCGALGSSCYDPAEGRWLTYRVRKPLLGFLVSLIAGNISGLLGVGGGFIKVPVINLVCGVPMKAATATSNFMIGMTAASSAFIYYGRGEVTPALTATVVLGVLTGSLVGAMISRRISSRVLQAIFAVFLAIVAVQMFLRAGTMQ